jgi:(2R)-ethylmalonyl-CoA mutase
LGLPRPWDQQWSLRLQQILAYETDLLEFGDIFEGAPVIEAKVVALMEEAREELARIEVMGGAVAAIDSAYMKERLVESNARRLAAIEAGEQTVVGVNAYTATAPSPLTDGADGGFLAVDPSLEAEQVARLEAWRKARDAKAAEAALAALKAAAGEGRNLMEPSIACARAGVTTGEWAGALRGAFGEYRAPTGVARAAALSNTGTEALQELRARVAEVSQRLGRRLKMLVGKPGLDGHSNGAEQIAVRARDAGFEVVYEGIRLTPAQIANAALEEGVHVVGLSVLSGLHVPLVGEVIERMARAGLGEVPVVAGGIIPPEDAAALREAGAAAVYTPKDYDLTAILADIVEIVERASREAA